MGFRSGIPGKEEEGWGIEASSFCLKEVLPSLCVSLLGGGELSTC